MVMIMMLTLIASYCNRNVAVAAPPRTTLLSLQRTPIHIAGLLVDFEKGGKGNSQEKERDVDGEIGRRGLEERIKD